MLRLALLALSIYLAAFSQVVGATRASGLLHEDLLHGCVRAPLAFFDMTPIGRIVNRFSSDVEVIDTLMAPTLDDWMTCSLDVVATLVVIAISTPLFFLVTLPLAVFLYFVQVIDHWHT